MKINKATCNTKRHWCNYTLFFLFKNIFQNNLLFPSAASQRKKKKLLTAHYLKELWYNLAKLKARHTFSLRLPTIPRIEQRRQNFGCTFNKENKLKESALHWDIWISVAAAKLKKYIKCHRSWCSGVPLYQLHRPAAVLTAAHAVGVLHFSLNVTRPLEWEH